MNRNRAPAYHDAAALLGPGAKVLVVGPFSRTWYADQCTLIELLSWFAEVGATPIVVSDAAFEVMARAAATLCDKPLTVLQASDEAAVTRVIEGSALCVVLVPRKGKTLEDAGPAVGEARRCGVPLLALYDDGDADFFPAEDP